MLLQIALALTAAAAILALSGLETKYLLMFCLMVAALLGLLLLNFSGLVYRVLFLGLGFSLIINPNKFIGYVDERHFGGVPGVFISLFDLGVAAVFLIRLFKGMSLSDVRVKKILPFAILLGLYGLAMCISSVNVLDEKLLSFSQIMFEFRAMFLFLLVGAGMLFADSSSRGTVLFMLAGVAAGIFVETAIVVAEYKGILPQGMSLLGIEAGGFQEMLDIGAMNRVGGTYRHPNYLAAAMVLVLPLFAAGFLVLRGLYKALFGAAACCTASLLVLTLSRGGFLAAGVSLAIMLAVLLSTRQSRSVLRRNAGWMLLSAVVLLGVIGAYSGPIYQKLFQSSTVNVSSRAELNAMALQMIRSSPVTGIGINYSTYGGRGFEYYNVYLSAFGLPPVVHNIYLLITAEIGIPGAVLFLAFILLLLSRAYSEFVSSKDETGAFLLAGAACGIIAYCVADLFEASLRKIEIAYLFWWCAGLAAFFSFSQPAAPHDRGASHDRRP